MHRGSFPSFWISPDVNLFDLSTKKGSKKPKHTRCNSGKTNPYQDQSSLIKLKSALQTVTRKQSPTSRPKTRKSPTSFITSVASPQPLKNSINKKNQVNLNPVQSKKKKNFKNKKKISKNKEEKLTVLDKKECKLAPKIFDNQIFCDIYDDAGNHDRVMETFEVSESNSRINDSSVGINYKFILASNLETEQGDPDPNGNIKPPDNSILADTERKIKTNHLELFEKLSNLAAERENNYEI